MWMYLLMVLLPGVLLSGWASMMVNSRFKHYSNVPTTRGYTGAQAAQRLLDTAGIHDVKIVRVNGFLHDHYNPVDKTLALSPEVYDRTSVAAIGVATHEAGHAIQHATGYYPLQLRSLLVPAVQFGSPAAWILIMLGSALAGGAGAAGGMSSALGISVLFLGILCFGLVVLFQLVTLPVEFNASNRAKQLVLDAGIIGHQEREGMDKVLNAAALTYVAAFVSSLLTLLYYLWASGLLGNNSND
jgi:Zn-dependent membrane protease YugP